MAKRRTAQRIERERVETVFGLTGGELETEPWVAVEPWECRKPEPLSYAYWYAGVPDYCERREHEQWEDPQARTVVVFGGGYLSHPAAWRVDNNGAWVLVGMFRNGGEAECPWRDADDDNAGYVRGRCDLCECDAAKGHGYVFLGEGYEAVYSLIEDSTFSREEWADWQVTWEDEA